MRHQVLNARPAADDSADATLVAMAKDGSEDAVRILVRRYNRQLFRTARGVVRDDAEAEDVVQETYVKAFTNLDSFRGDAGFSTWLTRIALNASLDRLRRRHATVEISAIEGASDENGGRVIVFTGPGPISTPESDADRSEVRRVLERAVDELDERFRLVFILRDIEGLTTEETAVALSIRPETVKTRLHRARAAMRKSIERSLSARFCDLFPFDGERCANMADRVVASLAARTRIGPAIRKDQRRINRKPTA